MHCRRFRSQPLSRRALLQSASCGFAAVALQALLGDKAFAGSDKSSAPHHAAKAKHVIFLYMDGGPSQVDTFDPKPALEKYDGKPFPTKTEPTQFNNNGNTLSSRWKFNQYGESGLPVSDLFPHIGTQADKLAMIHSMTSEFPEHTSANYFLHTGSGLQGRPSMGAWTTYGLGSDNQDLPGFVVLNGGLIPPGGIDNFNSGFLPAAYQGSIFNPGDPPVANIRPADRTAELQKNKLSLIERLDRASQASAGGDDQLESAIRNYELAYRMQTAVPELMDIRDETPATLEMYGLNDEFKNTQVYGRQCLTARRLIERGVRFVELTCPGGNGDRWDQHSNLKDGHTKNARTVDKPIAALLTDLQQRGLLDSTLVVFAGEFGRTPFAQGGPDGRDHNPYAFTIWMAGGGVQGGIRYGKSDEFGYKTVENRLMIHDLHATMLHLLGVDHERLTFRFSGRDMRLTDVHGNVIHDILT
ncbi:DUF1501 domain-containing protein [Blastopirellula marina]|uniref:DUF1501 domain-containing protein n=1 Tax=Blastopirellula marina TaxID=124 RepID=A0A2S8FTE8_9BACT|nr:DUF1501 domain-containing protein [Blastopirellula marina]PQO35104.1 DUF1501 domain-containing protein [Blastopirellula marina]PQO43470.1 DUF1501 domain-containing protein [Blastopirellula marina]PTL43853.1 DUF1501 domain-containing protein [Blastopirellula marina]